jgi:hypothetical protein
VKHWLNPPKPKFETNVQAKRQEKEKYNTYKNKKYVFYVVNIIVIIN